MTNEKRINVQKWWMKELQKLTQKVVNEEEKRKVRAQIKAEMTLGEFGTREDIMDAYAFGLISDKRKDRLLDMLDGVENTKSDEYDAKIDILTTLYEEAKQVLKGLEEEKE